MKQKSERGTRSVWAAMLSVDVVRQKHRLDFLGFVIAVEEIAEASSEERNQLAGFFRSTYREIDCPRAEVPPIPEDQLAAGSGGGSRKNGCK